VGVLLVSTRSSCPATNCSEKSLRSSESNFLPELQTLVTVADIVGAPICSGRRTRHSVAQLFSSFDGSVPGGAYIVVYDSL